MKSQSNFMSRPESGQLAIWVMAFLNVVASHGFELLISQPKWAGGQTFGFNPATLLCYALAGGSMGVAFLGLVCQRLFVDRGKLLLLVGILPFLSILWAPTYSKTFNQALLFAGSYFLAVVTAAYFNSDAIIRIAVRAGTISVVASLLMILFFPKIGLHDQTDLAYPGAWRGIFIHKNEFGNAMAVSLLLFMMVQKGELQSRLIRFLLTMGAAAGLAASRAASAIAFIFGTFVLVAVISPRVFSPIATAVTRIAIIPVAVLVVAGVSNQEIFNMVFARDMSLSGRVPFWEYILSNVDNPLLIGLGYSTGFEYYVYRAEDVQINFGEAFSSAHNGYLDWYLAFGLFGLCLIGSLMIQAFISASSLMRSTNPDLRLLARVAIVMLTLLLLTSLTESYLTLPTVVFENSFLFVAAVILRGRNLRKGAGESPRVQKAAFDVPGAITLGRAPCSTRSTAARTTG